MHNHMCNGDYLNDNRKEQRMIYLEYHFLKQRYKDAMALVDSILAEQEEIFTRTLPNAIRYDTDKVITSNNANILESYVIQKEQRHIEERLSEAKKILEERKSLLKEKESELRASKHNYDVVYVCRWLDRMPVWKICRKTHYSDRQVYRIMDRIRKEIK